VVVVYKSWVLGVYDECVDRNKCYRGDDPPGRVNLVFMWQDKRLADIIKGGTTY
jgi:hypothetical protein